MLAIRFVKKSVPRSWTGRGARPTNVFDGSSTIEEVGAAIAEVIDWGIARGQDMLEVLAAAGTGSATASSTSSTTSRRTFCPRIAKFVKGA